jgi:asparagine synthase (glutamine-hydrolysing)
MCGIAGIVNLDGGHVEHWRLQAINHAMAHRGPDGEGYLNTNGVGFAHLRLAIIDLTTGDQPIFNEDGSVAVVFNGEIYNFRDIKRLLQSLGHSFRTQSDSEVLVHAYEQWGSEMLAYLNGMFAFAIYDARRRKLFLARDRLGVKPLYYYLGKDKFVFASELNALVASDFVPRRIDARALELYLHYQYVPSPLTIYQGVNKLSPAEYIEFDIPTRQMRRQSYWDIATHVQPDTSKSLEVWLEELDYLLCDAVRIRLKSDVPFGAFLSGGVDSGLIVALMAGIMEQPVKTFSIGLADEGQDELPYARQTAQKFGTQHEEFRVTPEGLTLIPKLCPHFGEPFADSSAVPTYYVSKMARAHVKMVLTGDGGDEMFAGYRSYPYLVDSLSRGQQHLLATRLSATSSSSAIAFARRVYQRIPYLSDIKQCMHGFSRHFLQNATGVPWYDIHDISMSHFNYGERKKLLGGLRQLSPAEFMAERFPFPGADSVVGQAQYCDLKAYLPEDCLVKVDRMSMANSLEVRSPLLDYRVAELAFSMPTRLKLPEPLLDGSKNKFVLKEMASRYLGREYVYRPKEGFGIPVSRWLREDKAGYLRDSLLASSSPIYDYLDSEFVHHLVQWHIDGTGDYGYKLWNLLMLDGWFRFVHYAAL